MSDLGTCLRGHAYDFERVTSKGRKYKVCLVCRREHSRTWLKKHQSWPLGKSGRRVEGHPGGEALESLIFEIGVPGVAERFGVSVRTVHGWRVLSEEEIATRVRENWGRYEPALQLSLIRSEGVERLDEVLPAGWDLGLSSQAKALVAELRSRSVPVR